MSSEQVIACLHETIRPKWDHIACADCGAVRSDSGWGIARGHWFASLEYAMFYKQNGHLPDRLSTPAAGGDVSKMVVYRLRQCALGGPLAYDAIAIDEGADLIEQLQARNAEQAARIASQAETIGLMFKAGVAAEQDGLDAESKLSALLDGIEGLEKSLLPRAGTRDYANGTLTDFAYGREQVARDLKALREKANG